MSEVTTAPAPPAARTLRQADLAAAEAVGALMELWGFRRQLGRVWTVLFLSERPLAAPELCERLDISTGLLSMSLAELREWGVVRGVAVDGDRKEHYQAETNVWRLVAHVLRQRERKAVEAALSTFDRLLSEVRAAGAQGDPAARALARFKARRLEMLAGLCHAALNVLRLLLDSTRADVGPIKALSEAFGRRGPSPVLAPPGRGR
jgi:HTH-type transcriptional regulator, glycine betaine synthesis regulator